jgi:DNA helicase-2/ATP-dependent DNA helicase PcrA
MSLPAVLHPEIVEFLRQIPEKYVQDHIWNCIQKLRQQQFDRGLRVKKLKGINKKVWEARITQASRLIFTYEKSRHPQTGTAQVYLAIQDICLDHDDVSRVARARKRTPDTEWLDAEVLETIGSLEESSEPDFSTSVVEYLETEKLALEAEKTEELTINSEFKDELLSNIPWQVIESETQWYQAIIQQHHDLPIKLTPEEYKLVKLPGNLLLSGSAGTGKTTVALYRLMQSLENSTSGQRLYVAYNPLLVAHAQEQFQQLVGKNDSVILSRFQFKTIRDLCLEILAKHGHHFFPEDEVNLSAFWLLYRAHPKRKQYPTALLWDEIRSIIKGAQLSVDLDLLTKKEYEKLHKKRSTLISAQQRHEVYGLADWYQKKLAQDGRFDEIDLARKVLKVLKNNPVASYELIVCDEVQDFTELHLELLLKLAAPDGQFFFAGDLNQMISPSGFRWEDLKQKFYHQRQQVQEETLSFNFRSVGTLVHLSNQILRFRSRILNIPLSDLISAKQFFVDEIAPHLYGEPARLVSAPTTTLKSVLNHLNPGDAILVRTDEEKESFAGEFQSTLIFTIEEAKGLEFDTVYLVEFFQASQELWRKLFRNQSVSAKEQPALQLELNLLYVAITRARRILNIWESHLSQIWQEPELVNCVLPAPPQLVQQARVEPTPESWRQRGLYYLKAEFYRQAIECFEKAGDPAALQRATAKYCVQQRQYQQAAELFMKLKDWATAAPLFEKENLWQQAAKCWAKTDNIERKKHCEIYALEAAGQWEKAAKKWEKLVELEQAKRCWLNSNNTAQKAKIQASEWEQKKQWLKAAEQYEVAGFPQQAAECRALEYEKRQQWELASQQYEIAGNLEKAQICRTKIPFDSLEETPDFGKRGNLRLSTGDYQGAIADYDQLLQLHPNYGYAYHNRGVARHRLNDYAGAIADYTQALNNLSANDPRILKTLSYRGAAYSAMGHHDLALQDYNQVLQTAPEDISTYNNRAATLHRLGNYEGAMNDYTLVIQKDSKNALAYGNRGAAKAALGDHLAAILDFTKAIHLNPTLNQIYYHRGNAYLAVGNYQAAIQDFNQELKQSASSQIYYKRGNAYLAVGNYQAAIEDFNQELKQNPNHAAAYSDRAIARSSLGNHQGAIEDLNQAIQLNPHLAAAYNNRGAIRRDLGDTEGALEDYNQAIEINPKYADAYYNRGVSRSVLGDIQGAIIDWQESVRLNPKNPLAYYNLGVSQIQQEDYQGAVEFYTKAIEAAPEFAEAFYERGVTFKMLEKPERALQDLKIAAKLFAKRGDSERTQQIEEKMQLFREEKGSGRKG